jgi:hypothetical protein
VDGSEAAEDTITPGRQAAVDHDQRKTGTHRWMSRATRALLAQLHAERTRTHTFACARMRACTHLAVRRAPRLQQPPAGWCSQAVAVALQAVLSQQGSLCSKWEGGMRSVSGQGELREGQEMWADLVESAGHRSADGDGPARQPSACRCACTRRFVTTALLAAAILEVTQDPPGAF